jgi:hypothetical protein
VVHGDVNGNLGPTEAYRQAIEGALFLLRRVYDAIGTKRTYRDVWLFVRFQGEADMRDGAASTSSVVNDRPSARIRISLPVH